MPYFFVSPEHIKDDKVVITGPDVKHISKVLRLGAGDTITVLDGCGRAYQTRIREVSKRQVECVILQSVVAGSEPFLKVTLVQGLPKANKIEMIIEKGTELGVAAVIPLYCNRSVVQLDPQKVQQRLERWRRVAKEAAQQCCRAVVPEVKEPVDLPQALALIPPGALSLMLWEEEKSVTLKSMLRSFAGGQVFLFIGPEGGFDSQEVDLARKQGVVSVSLGSRILRTETAGIAAMTIVLYELGDLGG